MTTNTEFAVFANGTFCGVWSAEDESAAIKMAADEVGTEGNTDGMTAVPSSEVSAEDMEV